MSALKLGALVRDNEALRAEVERLRAALVPMANWLTAYASHARKCERCGCARTVCDTCVCSCGLDAAMQAALDSAGPARA